MAITKILHISENKDWAPKHLKTAIEYITNPEKTGGGHMTFAPKKQMTENYLKGCTDQGFRTEYLTDDAMEVLRLAKEINPDGEYVFMPKGKPIVTLTFNKRLKKYCEAVGIPYRSSHKIRFYACSTAYDGENLAQISKMVGHSQVSTTLRYLRDTVQDDDCSSLFDKLGPQKQTPAPEAAGTS